MTTGFEGIVDAVGNSILNQDIVPGTNGKLILLVGGGVDSTILRRRASTRLEIAEVGETVVFSGFTDGLEDGRRSGEGSVGDGGRIGLGGVGAVGEESGYGLVREDGGGGLGVEARFVLFEVLVGEGGSGGRNEATGEGEARQAEGDQGRHGWWEEGGEGGRAGGVQGLWDCRRWESWIAVMPRG